MQYENKIYTNNKNAIPDLNMPQLCLEALNIDCVRM